MLTHSPANHHAGLHRPVGLHRLYHRPVVLRQKRFYIGKLHNRLCLLLMVGWGSVERTFL